MLKNSLRYLKKWQQKITYFRESFLKRKDRCRYYYFNVKIKTCSFWNSPYMYAYRYERSPTHRSWLSIVIQRESSRIVFSSHFTSKPKAAHFSKHKRQIKWSERRSVYLDEDFVYAYHTEVVIARTYVYNWHTSADRVYFDHYFLFLRFFFSRLCLRYFFLSLFLCRSCLLYYFVTGLRSCFFVVFFYFFFHSVLPSVYPLRAFFPPFFFFFLFLFSLAALFATNHTTRYPYFRLFDY